MERIAESASNDIEEKQFNNFLKEQNDFKKVEYMQNLLIKHSTGDSQSEYEYKKLRTELLKNSWNNSLPDFIRNKRSLAHFWNFIKNKFSTYRDRREFISDSFTKSLNNLEFPDDSISSNLEAKQEVFINAQYIYDEIRKGLKRKDNDPEGAVTIAKTVIESVCKYILDNKNISYSTSIRFAELYKLAAKELNMSSDQHTEKVFKQILGGCSGVIGGINQLRNLHGDAHGKTINHIKIKPRHSELAVGLSGSIAVFLFETFLANQNKN